MLKSIPLPRIDPPSEKELKKKYLSASRPIVIKGLIDEWPALKLWTPDYLSQKFGDVEAGIIKLKDGFITYEGVTPETDQLSKSIANIANGDVTNSSIIASLLDNFPPSFHQDYIPPKYWTRGKFLTSHIIIAPENSVTPLHQDLPENLLVVIKGIKRVTLFSPFSSVYPNSRFSNRPQFSQIDVENPDYERFPKLKSVQPYVVDLMAGDTLFIPSFWWHHVRNIEPTIAMNFWWSEGWMLPIAFAKEVYKYYKKM